MSTITLSDVVAFIASSATQDDVSLIHEAANQRTKALRSIRAAGVGVGTEVKIVNISPKALSGLTGKVTAINGKHCTVLLDETSTTTLKWGRTRHAAAVPHDATEYAMSGIPLTCCEPVDA